MGICARYFWVLFDLDDTQSATIDGGGSNGRKDILDFTINYIINSLCNCPVPSGLSNNTAADRDNCADTGVIISWAKDASNWGDGGTGTRTYVVLRNGTAITAELVYGTTSYIDTTGTNGTGYTYSVRYVNGCSSSAITTGASAADVVDTTPCPNVGNTLRMSKSGTNAVISWTAVTCADLANYKVYGATNYSDPFPTGWSTLGLPTGTTFTDPLISSYRAYKTVSVDACNNQSSY